MSQNEVQNAQNETVEESSNNTNNVDIQKLIQKEIQKALSKVSKKAAAKPVEDDDVASLSQEQASDPVVAKLLQKVEKLERKNRESEQSAKEARTRAQRREAESAIQSTLSSKVSPEILDLLVPHLVQQNVVLREDGSTLFNFNDTEYEDLQTGVADFLNSPKGQKYLSAKPRVTKPAAGVQQSRTSNVTLNQTPEQNLTLEEKAWVFLSQNPDVDFS
jgi:hypothetical protein